MESKYVIFAFTLFVALPIGTIIAALSSKIREVMFFLFVFLTAFDLGSIDINFVSREWYRMPTRGIELSLLDFFGWILILAIPLTQLLGKIPKVNRGSRAGMIPFLIYSIYASVSLGWSEEILFSLMEWTKLIRSLLIFFAAYTFIRGRRELLIFGAALACGLIYEGGLCLVQRYVHHVHRLHGALGHANNVAYFCNFATPVVLVFGLTESVPSLLRKICLAASVSGMMCVMMTLSRTGMAVLLFVMVGSYFFAGFKLNVKSLVGLFCAILLFSGALFKVSDSFLGRMNSKEAEGSERSSYYMMAEAIVKDHPFGVGLNNWSYVVTRGYCRVFFPPSCVAVFNGPDREPEHSEIAAHTIYGLTIAELGWLGILLLLIMWGNWLIMAMQMARWKVSELGSKFGIGLFFAQMGNMGESATEYVFRYQNITFLFHLSVGAMVGVYVLERQQRKERKLAAGKAMRARA